MPCSQPSMRHDGTIKKPWKLVTKSGASPPWAVSAKLQIARNKASASSALPNPATLAETPSAPPAPPPALSVEPKPKAEAAPATPRATVLRPACCSIDMPLAPAPSRSTNVGQASRNALAKRSQQSTSTSPTVLAQPRSATTSVASNHDTSSVMCGHNFRRIKSACSAAALLPSFAPPPPFASADPAGRAHHHWRGLCTATTPSDADVAVPPSTATEPSQRGARGKPAKSLQVSELVLASKYPSNNPAILTLLGCLRLRFSIRNALDNSACLVAPAAANSLAALLST
mmetsp:Transcript_2175/g.8502  ORF Transcript_2175/g.8502 Transcript_2175/m.8502 type:complete len:287 (-) Transcript_2175:662-1522(-)